MNKINFFIFGVGMLLPYNAQLAAMDFFTQEFPDYNPSFSLLVAVSGPMVGVQAIAFFFVQKMPLHFKVTTMFVLDVIVTFGLVLAPLIISDE